MDRKAVREVAERQEQTGQGASSSIGGATMTDITRGSVEA